MSTNGTHQTNGQSDLNSKTPSGSSNNQELFDFKQFYSIIKRHVWLITACVIVGVATAYYLSYEYFLPVYNSSSTLLIKSSSDRFPGGKDEFSQIISNSYDLNMERSIRSQIHFLTSQGLANEVAKQVEAAKFLPDSSIYPLLWQDYPDDSTIVSTQTLAGRIRSGLKVAPIEEGSDILSVTFESYSPYEAARVVNFSINAYKDITAEKKRSSAKSALNFLQNKRSEVKKKLNQAENQLSGFRSNKNLVSIESQTSNMVNAVSDLQTQKQKISVQLEAAKAGIQNHKKQLQAIKPGLGKKYSEAAGPTITNYQQKLAQLQTDRMVLISNNPRLKNNPDSEPQLQKLDKQIADLKSAITKLTDNLMNDSDNYLGLLAGSDGNVTQEISKIQSTLTGLQIEKSQYEAQLQAINQRLQSNENFLQKVPSNQKELARLKRRVDIYEQLFNTVNQHASQVSLWEQTQSSAGTVIDYASVHHNPVKPQKPLWLLGGFLLGLILPIGFVLLKESLTDKINSIEDLKKTPYPLLAIIYDHSLLNKKKANKISKPADNKDREISQDLILYHYGLSPIAESYRTLVSKVLYSNPDNPPKTILVTSPGAGVGKTTLTSNLATGLVETGNRVLIIDCDMRKPGLPGFMNISRDPGIMEILFNDVPPEEAVRPLPIPGMDILTTGKKQPARPTSVIGSQSFQKLIERFRFEYDFILLDSAPFGIIGDVAPILHLTDGVIVASRFQQTKHIELNHTLDQLESNSAQVLGLVLNGYNPSMSIDDTEIKSLYNYKYNGYYDYQEANDKEKKYVHEKIT